MILSAWFNFMTLSHADKIMSCVKDIISCVIEILWNAQDYMSFALDDI